jgi:hypothetical protein
LRLVVVSLGLWRFDIPGSRPFAVTVSLDFSQHGKRKKCPSKYSGRQPFLLEIRPFWIGWFDCQDVSGFRLRTVAGHFS